MSAIKAEEISYSLKGGEVFCRFVGRRVTSRFWCELLGKEVRSRPPGGGGRGFVCVSVSLKCCCL